MKKHRNSGYSVIELSIVLIIIGIISATFLGAATLYKNSQIVSVAVKFEDYRAAALGFNLQYGARPGDFTDATDFWPDNNTDNGNGNGAIDATVGADGEYLRAWQHLGLSRFIKGSFGGTYDGGYRNSGTDVLLPNIPLVADERATFFMGEMTATTETGDRTLNALVYSRFSRTDTFFQGSLSRADAQMVDEKIDDGDALSGNIIGTEEDGFAAGEECVDNTTRSRYTLTPDIDDVYCVLVFWIED